MLRFVQLLLLVCLAACASTGVYHRVETGQTLYRISKEYDVSEATIRRVNGIRDPSQLQAGSMLFIPGATQVRSVPATVPGTSVQAKPSRTAPTAKKTTKTARPRPVARSQPKTVTARPPTPEPPATAQKGLFDWPLRGKIHRRFGEKSGSPKGVEIQAPEGTPVRAAAAGRVIYSDAGIRGFGHLVILQHDGDYFTIYGYNRSNLVSSGAYVSRGQKIALSGRPASGGPARLHFELRRGKTPVNPILYLP